MSINTIGTLTFALIYCLFPLNVESLTAEDLWGTTTFNVDELKYSWTINNFDSIRLADMISLHSPEFWAANDEAHKWRLGFEVVDGNDTHGIYLQPCFNDSLKVKFSISINGIESSAIHNFTDGTQFGFQVPVGAGFEVVDMDSNTMTIDCKIRKVDSVKNSTRRCDASKEFVPVKELFNDMELLFKNGKLSDVTFQFATEHATLKAHKAILGARSSVFLEQLQRDTDAYYRYRDVLVEIRDTEFRVFKELLRYMYVGKVEHLENIAEKLLIAAEKYKIKSLKKLCEEQLCKNLNTHNAFETLNFANEHHLPGLTTIAARFIATHGSSIMRTNEFKDIESKLNNSLLNVFQAYYGD